MSATIKLRNYQRKAVDAIYQEWYEGNHRLLAVLATGLGKSVIISQVISLWNIERDGAVLVVAHKRKLVEQLTGHIARTGITSIGVEMGLDKSRGSEDIIVGTVQSISRRIKKLDPKNFGLVIVDEAHHDTAKSQLFNVLESWTRQNPSIKRLGVTASTGRSDKAGYTDRYDKIAFEMSLNEGVAQGFLVEPKTYVLGIEGLRFDKIRHNFSSDDIEKALSEDERTIHKIAAQIIAFCKDKKFLVFMPTKASARRLCDILNNHPDNPHKAMSIDCDCHEEERTEFFEKTKEGGEIRQMVGCDMLTEGYDCPDIEVVVLCTPVGANGKSSLIQRVGRGTRPLSSVASLLRDDMHPEERKGLIAASNKPYLAVLDLCGFSGKHNLIMAAEIEGDIDPEIKGEIGLLASSGLREPVSIEEIKRQAMDRLAKKREQKEKEERILRELMPAVFARAAISEVTETGMDELGRGNGMKYKPTKEPPTVAQIKYLQRVGINTDGVTKNQAKELIATTKRGGAVDYQLKLIKQKLGKSQLPELTYYQAEAIIHCLRDRKTPGDPPVFNRSNVKIIKSDSDKKYRIFIIDSATKRILQFGEPHFMASKAIFIARQLVESPIIPKKESND